MIKKEEHRADDGASLMDALICIGKTCIPDQWQVLPFRKSTLDDNFLILLQSWKKEEKPHLIPCLKEMEKRRKTTNDDIYVNVLQRLQKAHVLLGATLTYEEAKHIEEDENGREIYVPSGEVQVWFMVEDEIKLYEGNKIVLPNSAFSIDDLEEVGFEVEEHHPSPLDMSLSFEERMEQTTNMETLCSLINELADMGVRSLSRRKRKMGLHRYEYLMWSIATRKTDLMA